MQQTQLPALLDLGEGLWFYTPVLMSALFKIEEDADGKIKLTFAGGVEQELSKGQSFALKSALGLSSVTGARTLPKGAH